MEMYFWRKSKIDNQCVKFGDLGMRYIVPKISKSTFGDFSGQKKF
jgi:hypothetical protein